MNSPITTHVLDTASGRPAAGIAVTLEIQAGAGWNPVGRGTTDADGRAGNLIADGKIIAATYRLRFDTEAYFHAQKSRTFYPFVEISFAVTNADERYHVPLLLGPYGYTTYRGS